MTATAPAGLSFEEHLEQLNLSGARLGYVLVAVLMPAGLTLDYFMHPEWVLPFLGIRILSSAVALALLGVTHLPREGRIPLWLESAPPLVAAVAIEGMILLLEGVHSPYYAGLNLTILAMAVLFTWTWQHALVVSGLTVAMWLLPAIPVGLSGQLDTRIFFNNFYFLTLTSVIAVAATAMRHRLARSEFDARVELAATSAELVETLAQLREADRLKSEFFANVSHELRTPLTLILAPVDEILTRPEPSPDAAALRIVRRNAGRLLRMIDDLLDLARLEGGGMRLNVGPIDIPGLARRVVENARPTAGTRGVVMGVEGPETMPVVLGDPHRIEIILTNLVGNAVKFTPDGGRIDVAVGNDEGVAWLEVRDSGPGIPEELHEQIFRRFYQVHGSERRKHGGAGIGLALARELARLHGGDVTVKSEEGAGATFRVTLPLGDAHLRPEIVERRKVKLDEHPGRRSEDVAEDEGGQRADEMIVPPRGTADPIVLDRGRLPLVLVAEDEDDLRKFIVGVLSKEFRVLAARDGEEAYERVQKERPDLVLTDVMMPGTSGTDLCRRIKQDPMLMATPVIMLTARSGPDAALEGYASGADDFIGKPFHTQVLIARVRAQLTLRALSIQLADQARLAAAGALAAGVAHEVRNPINAIVNAANVLEGGGSSRVPREKLLEIIVDGVRRIDGVVGALDAHARPADGMEVSRCDVRAGVESTLRLLSHRLDGVKVHTRFSEPGSVYAAGRELNQIVLNLLDNALRATRENIWVDVDSSGGRVRLTVSDDGPGVPAAIVGRIFDPFFTTRAQGEGTGLGLYLSRRMSRDAGGDLLVQDREGGGATFVLELPGILGAPEAPRHDRPRI